MVSPVSWRNYRKELTTPSKNSYVYKLGFRYAIQWYRRIPEAEKEISSLFGDPNHQWHFSSWRGSVSLRTGVISYPARRWYYGTREWNKADSRHGTYWAVFKSDADRTLALLKL